MSKSLLHALARGVWEIEPGYANSQKAFISQILKNNINQESESFTKEQVPVLYVEGSVVEIESDTWYGASQLKNVPEGSTVIIPVSGPVLRNDNCGSPGTMTLASWIKMSDKNPNVDLIVVNLHTPGGESYGTGILADAIKNCKTPTIAYVNDGICASAGYRIAVACDEIYVSNDTCQVGSIGVFVEIANWEKHFKEKEMLEIHTVYSDYSEEKNQLVTKVLEGDNEPIKKEFINPIALSFISAVKSGRQGKLNLSAGDPFKGKMFMAPLALEIGLIDGIKSFEDVLGKGTGSSSLNVNSNSDNNMKKLNISAAFTSVLSFFGIEAKEGKESHEVEYTEEQMNELMAKADNALKLTSQLGQKETELASLRSELETKQGEISALTQAKQENEARIAELEASPGAGAHAIVPNADVDPNGPLETRAGTSEVDKEAQEIYQKTKDKN